MYIVRPLNGFLGGAVSHAMWAKWRSYQRNLLIYFQFVLGFMHSNWHGKFCSCFSQLVFARRVPSVTFIFKLISFPVNRSFSSFIFLAHVLCLPRATRCCESNFERWTNTSYWAQLNSAATWDIVFYSITLQMLLSPCYAHFFSKNSVSTAQNKNLHSKEI